MTGKGEPSFQKAFCYVYISNKHFVIGNLGYKKGKLKHTSYCDLISAVHLYCYNIYT